LCVSILWQKDEEEDVRSYWMALRTGEDILIWRRRLWIALYGGIVWRRLWTCRQTEYWM